MDSAETENRRLGDRRESDRRGSERRLEDARPYQKIVADAISLEKVGKWSEAAALWDSAVKAARRVKKGTKEAAARAAAARVVSAARGDAAGAAKAVSTAAKREAHEAKLAKEETARAKLCGLKAGDVVKHSERGVTTAECTYRGERSWLYDGTAYTSVSAAANAAAAKLGKRSRTLNGWNFWGLEKREP